MHVNPEFVDAIHAWMHEKDSALRWDDLKILLAVIREGSFTAASERLGVEQSTVSRRIAALEESLDVVLFDRHRGGPKPTEVALAIRERLERIDAEARGIADALEARELEVRGRVRLALTESLAVHAVIPHLLSSLRSEHPGLAVDLVTSDQVADLTRRDADLAIRFFRPTDGDLVTKRVAQMRTSVLAHRSYEGVGRDDPKRLDWILHELPGIDTPEARFLREVVGVEPAMRTTGYMAQVAAVQAGLGVAVLASSLRILDPGLVELELGLPKGPTLELWLACPKGLRDVPRVAAVWSALERSLPRLEI